jgi:hypothetical protein
MSEHEHAVPTGDIDGSESFNADLSQLTELARQAYHQKRTKNCLDLVRAILLIDPENAEAQLMRSSIRMEMHLDLENARTLLRDAHLKDRSQMYSEAGSTVLRRILSMDPESEEARTLLSEVERSAPSLPSDPPASPQPPLTLVVDEQPVTAVSPIPRPHDPIDRRRIAWGAVIISVALAVASLPFLRTWSPSEGAPAVARRTTVSPVSNTAQSRSNIAVPANVSPEPVSPTNPPSPPPAADAAPAASVPAVVREPAVPRPTARPVSDTVVTEPGGRLAISSPTPVEIYLGDQHVGSAPITIDISPGTYSFEYRHGTMVKTVTHVVKSNETTRATVFFDIPVQVNARPWADVFVEGTEMKPLGQTPMSSVRVPIGGVLVFQNPKFPPKRYRVTGKESTIQIVFP